VLCIEKECEAGGNVKLASFLFRSSEANNARELEIKLLKTEWVECGGYKMLNEPGIQ